MSVTENQRECKQYKPSFNYPIRNCAYCQLITTSQSERSSYRRWRVAYLLSEAQCSEDLLVSLPPKSTLLTVTISDGKLHVNNTYVMIVWHAIQS